MGLRASDYDIEQGDEDSVKKYGLVVVKNVFVYQISHFQVS